MGYNALITLDLPIITSEERKVFYEVLKQFKWVKIKDLTTVWRASFNDSVISSSAITILINDLKTAKMKSGINKVEYALLLGKGDVKNGSI